MEQVSAGMVVFIMPDSHACQMKQEESRSDAALSIGPQ